VGSADPAPDRRSCGDPLVDAEEPTAMSHLFAAEGSASKDDVN